MWEQWKLRAKQKHFCQVGCGEGVINLRASAEPFKGLKLNTEAKSSWKLTVDAVQVEIMSRFAPFSWSPFTDGLNRDSGWWMAIWTVWWLWFNFTCVECPVSWAAFPGQSSHAQDEGSQVIDTTTFIHVYPMQVYPCLTESSACLAPTSLRYLVTLVPSEGGENFSEVDLGSVFSYQKWLLCWSHLSFHVKKWFLISELCEHVPWNCLFSS